GQRDVGEGGIIAVDGLPDAAAVLLVGFADARGREGGLVVEPGEVPGPGFGVCLAAGWLCGHASMVALPGRGRRCRGGGPQRAHRGLVTAAWGDLHAISTRSSRRPPRVPAGLRCGKGRGGCRAGWVPWASQRDRGAQRAAGPGWRGGGGLPGSRRRTGRR